ncbi:hypothetical protein [Gloeothece citriformis]|uniref:hypothetical protein n=1 Tax=Gloeothece citriformis TaxID=2546356 RepID=UPI00059C0D71|nr:hypothetical protein [Gloeothece citriformis]
MRNAGDSSQPTTKPQATRQPQPKTVTRPVVQNVPVRRTPVEPVVRQPQPRPQPVAVSYRQPVPSRPVPPPTRIVSPQTPSVAPVPPTQLWAQLAQVGSFGGGLVSNNNPPTTGQSIPKYEPKTASTAVVEDTQSVKIPSQDPYISSVNPYISSVNDDNAIAFGQSVSAVLETTIAWERSRSNNTTVQHNDERYIITLAQPLKDKSGNFVIPAGSQLIARLSGESNALVTLTTESIIVNGVQTQLPQGALTVTGVEGQPLIAEMKTLGEDNRGDNGQVLADVLSIAGDFADIRGTRSLSGLYRTLGGGRTRSSGISVTVFFLEEGTPLEVFVNKAFNFENPEAPLELDLSLWESDGRREGN